MFSFSLKFSGSLLMILFAVAATALKDSDRSIPPRFKRQFDNNGSPSLAGALNTLQQQQQSGQSSGSDQFPSGSAQFPSWSNTNAGNQGSLNNNQNAQDVIRPQTTQRTPANQISNQNTVNEAQCIRNCPATNQWNPVCGTDNISYGNVNKLRCAQQCGRQVQFVYNGSCVTTPSPNK